MYLAAALSPSLFTFTGSIVTLRPATTDELWSNVALNDDNALQCPRDEGICGEMESTKRVLLIVHTYAQMGDEYHINRDLPHMC
jgi:hypothetical protein